MSRAPFTTYSIRRLAIQNRAFRRVLYTPQHLQLVLMTLRPGQEIGSERHRVDQFFRIEDGAAIFVIGGREYRFGSGGAVVVPAGTRHNVINPSRQKDLYLYTLYAPPQHPPGSVAKTKFHAERLKRDPRTRARRP